MANYLDYDRLHGAGDCDPESLMPRPTPELLLQHCLPSPEATPLAGESWSANQGDWPQRPGSSLYAVLAGPPRPGELHLGGGYNVLALLFNTHEENITLILQVRKWVQRNEVPCPRLLTHKQWS